MDGDPAEVVAAYENEVQETDAASLRRKFDQGVSLPTSAGASEIRMLRPTQPVVGATVGVLLKAMQDTVFEVDGSGSTELKEPDLQLSIFRIDDTLMWQDRVVRHCDPMILRAAFQLRITMNPLLLGEGLYRIDAVLRDGATAICGRSEFFEIQDDQGQHGGRPMLYYPPDVRTLPREVLA